MRSGNHINAFELESPESPEHSSEGNKGAASSMDYHISFPLVFEVAGASDLNESEENPNKEENEAVHEVECDSFVAFDCGAHCSQLADVGLQIVRRQFLEVHLIIIY